MSYNPNRATRSIQEIQAMSKPAPAKPAAQGKPAVETGAPAPQNVAAQPLTGAAAAMQTASAFKYELEDNIPIPTKRIGVKGESAYPFAVMGINQSFFVPQSDAMKEPWKTLTSMASRMGREHHPKKFVTSREKRGDVDGVRVWRTADATGELPPPRVRNTKKADAGTGDATQQPQGGADPFAGQQQPAAA